MLLVLLVVLVAALVVADRVGHSYAEKTVAQQLGKQAAFTSPPTVRIEGVPFLTQAAAGTYDHVVVDGSGLSLGQLHDVGFHADLHGVHVPLSDALGGRVRTVPVDRADGAVVIPYAEFARQTGIDGLTITESGGRLTVTAPVEVDVAFLHERFDVVADGRVAAAGGGRDDLALSVDNIRVAGVSLPGAAVDYISSYLNDRVTLPPLPYGLQLQAVTPAADGLHVAVGGTDLTVGTS